MLLTRIFGRLAPTEFVAAATSSLSSKSPLATTSLNATVSTNNLSTTSKETKKATDANLTIEDSCLKRLKEIFDNPQEEFLRIDVETGGCSGFSYMFDIDNKNNLDPNEDLIFERESYRVVIKRDILPYMKGSIIEYNESLIKSSFQVKNPIAETKCSCGASFSIDPNKIK